MQQQFLLVDDDQSTLDLFSKIIRSHFPAVQLTTYKSGHEAIKCMEEQTTIDLVISDYSMRGGDGISLAHYCHHRNIPCIIVSGFAAEDITPYLPRGIVQLNKVDCMRPNILADRVQQTLQAAVKP